MSLLDATSGKNYIGGFGTGGPDASAVRLRKDDTAESQITKNYNGPDVSNLLATGNVNRP